MPLDLIDASDRNTYRLRVHETTHVISADKQKNRHPFRVHSSLFPHFHLRDLVPHFPFLHFVPLHFLFAFSVAPVICLKWINSNLPHPHLAPYLGMIPFEFRQIFQYLATENYSPLAIVWRCLRDPKFSHFDTITACDRHTYRHTTTAYTALA